MSDLKKNRQAAASGAQTGSFEALDPVIHEQAVAPWELVTTSLESDSFHYSMTYLNMPGMTLYKERCSGKMRLQGLSPPNTIAFAIPEKFGQETSWWKAPLHERGVPVMLPGGIDVEMAAGQTQHVALVELELLRTALPGELMERIELAARNHLLTASPKAIELLGATLASVLRTAQRQPGMLQQQAVVDAMQQDILDAFTQTISLVTPGQLSCRRNIRQNGMARAIDFLRSSEQESVTVAELCVEAQVSWRTLDYAFKEFIGLSPRSFLQLRKLHQARRDLLACNDNSTTVAEIAQANGFYQSGRFTGYFKQAFGELPSQTLKRSCRNDEKNLLRLSS